MGGRARRVGGWRVRFMLYRCVAIDEVDRGAGCKRGKRCTVFTPTYLLIWRAVTSAPAYFPPPAPAPLLNFQYEGNRVNATLHGNITDRHHHDQPPCRKKFDHSTGLDGVYMVHQTSRCVPCVLGSGCGCRSIRRSIARVSGSLSRGQQPRASTSREMPGVLEGCWRGVIGGRNMGNFRRA